MEGGLSMEYDGGTIEVKKGEVVLVPAEISNLTLSPAGEFKLLESYIA
jgi:uncharacterized protein YjlB